MAFPFQLLRPALNSSKYALHKLISKNSSGPADNAAREAGGMLVAPGVSLWLAFPKRTTSPLRGLMNYFLSILGFATLTPGFMLPAAPQPPWMASRCSWLLIINLPGGYFVASALQVSNST